MRIGELAKRTGLSRDTIRFYERQGLIASEPPTEASNSYRNYPEALVGHLNMVVEARAAGFSVSELSELIVLMENWGDADFDANNFLENKIAKLKNTITQAQKLLATLEATQAALEAGPVEWR